MYPGTIVAFEDESTVDVISANTVRNQPLYAATFTSDKGEEGWKVVEGKDFFTRYGNDISFAKHGQPLLQAAMSCNWGAKVLCKRIVAADAMLANFSIVATVNEVTEQKKNSEAVALYWSKDPTGTYTAGQEPVEATTVTTWPVMINKGAKISYSALTATNVKSIDDAVTAAEAAVGEEANKFLLYTISDNGRGVSNKRFMILPDYTLSKSYDGMIYNFVVIENGNILETIRFSLDPDTVMNNINISLADMVRTNSKQVKIKQHSTEINGFLDYIKEKTLFTEEQMIGNDILFGCNKKGVVLSNITVDTTTAGTVNLQNPYGQSLTSGTNGAFGNDPMKNSTYPTLMAAAYTTGEEDVIYNLDRYKIDAIIDANYPSEVKRAIEVLADFREDFAYLRDIGVKNTSIESIVASNNVNSKSKFCTTYENSYDIIDPFSKKQITVTIGYSLARLVVAQFNNGTNLPLAGLKYSMTIPEAIDGTVNFIPVVTPAYNQKEQLDEARVNYASYIDESLVIETLYTSYDKVSQYSYLNNILAIQEVIKAIRTRCPAIRYSFQDGDDLEKYKADVNEVISKYESNFTSLKMEYIADNTYISNKIFYAALKVQCKNFIQSEYFRIIALNDTTTVS